MTKDKIWTLIQVMPLILAVVLVISICGNGLQATVPIPFAEPFRGEYSQNGGPWQPLTEETELSAMDGELILRGNFGREIQQGEKVNFLLNHIAMKIEINGEEIDSTPNWQMGEKRDFCGKYWDTWSFPNITQEDVVEITLRNMHNSGNETAYADFLHGIYIAPDMVFRAFLDQSAKPFHWAGAIMMVVSLVFLGVAMAFLSIRNGEGVRLGKLGMAAFFAGGYILLDHADTSYWNDLLAVNTYGIYLCMIFAIFFFGMYLAGELRSSAKKVAVAAVAAEGVLILVQLVPCLLDLTVIYDTMLYWRYGQMIVSAVLLLCCFYEFRKKGQMDRKNLFSSVLMLFAILAEVLNFMAGWWTQGLCLKLMFLLQFLFYVCRSFTSIPEKYRTSVDAEQLEEELKNSRIILAMGQIRTHFIFNVLNAISGMCKYDPEKADETIVRFARYLRGNIDILQNDRPISFSAEIKHLEDYIVLEQMRFGDEKIKYIRKTEIEDFFLPPLVLQPIVENAIKHGLLPKEEGGTIFLRTWTDGKDIFITIEDDGVGFDLQSLSENTQSIGLDNVRFRLMHMIHGRMEIQTEIGKGTVVTMMIPCKEGLKCM